MVTPTLRINLRFCLPSYFLLVASSLSTRSWQGKIAEICYERATIFLPSYWLETICLYQSFSNIKNTSLIKKSGCSLVTKVYFSMLCVYKIKLRSSSKIFWLKKRYERWWFSFSYIILLILPDEIWLNVCFSSVDSQKFYKKFRWKLAFIWKKSNSTVEIKFKYFLRAKYSGPDSQSCQPGLLSSGRLAVIWVSML